MNIEIQTKRCSKCQNVKDISNELCKIEKTTYLSFFVICIGRSRINNRIEIYE